MKYFVEAVQLEALWNKKMHIWNDYFELFFWKRERNHRSSSTTVWPLHTCTGTFIWSDDFYFWNYFLVGCDYPDILLGFTELSRLVSVSPFVSQTNVQTAINILRKLDSFYLPSKRLRCARALFSFWYVHSCSCFLVVFTIDFGAWYHLTESTKVGEA